MNRGRKATFILFSIPFFLLCVMACKPSHTSLVVEPANTPLPDPNKDKEKEDKGSKKMAEKTLAELVAQPEFIDFSHINKFVLQNHCMECHDSKTRRDSVDVSSFEYVLNGNSKKLVFPQEPDRSSLYTTLVLAPSASRHMPPKEKPQLSEEQIDLVYHWIRLGAQQVAPELPTSNDNGEPKKITPPPKREPSIKQVLQPYFDHPETIDFSVVDKHIVQPLCIKCHSQNSTHKHKKDALYSADMTNYKALFDPFAPIIKVGNHQRSKMFKAAAVNQTMPPPMDGYDPVDPYLVKLLRLWIINCAIEDYAKFKGETLLKDPAKIKVRLCEGQ